MRGEKTMESISLTYFVDFMLTSGPSRITSARNIKQGPDERYSDFYRPVREAIVDMHRMGLDTRVLADLLSSLEDPREKRLFTKAVIGYGKFLRQHPKLTWFEPPRVDHQLGSVAVRVNPELGLLIAGQPHAIKLYFRGESLSPRRAVLVNEILDSALAATWPGMVLGVLDVRNARFFPHKPKAAVNRLLRAEADSLASLLAS
jgi:hypothetical protein